MARLSGVSLHYAWVEVYSELHIGEEAVQAIQEDHQDEVAEQAAADWADIREGDWGDVRGGQIVSSGEDTQVAVDI